MNCIGRNQTPALSIRYSQPIISTARDDCYGPFVTRTLPLHDPRVSKGDNVILNLVAAEFGMSKVQVMKPYFLNPILREMAEE
jgi:hypothetical protein